MESFTPPKYANRLVERNNLVFLEDRLKHFVNWLNVNGFAIGPAGGVEGLTKGQIDTLVDRYMNE